MTATSTATKADTRAASRKAYNLIAGVEPENIEIESYIWMDIKKGEKQYRRFRGTMADVKRWMPNETLEEICYNFQVLEDAGFAHTVLRIKGE